MKLSHLTALFAVLFSVKAWSQNVQLVSLKQLHEKQVDDKAISDLVKSDYLMPTSHPGFYYINSSKIDSVMKNNLDLGRHEFLKWLKTNIKPEIKVQIKNPKDMYLGTQDIHGGAKDKTSGH